jgi:hypothetical protein
MISAGVLGLATTLALPAPSLAATRTLTFDGDFIDLSEDGTSVLLEEQGFRFTTSSFYPDDGVLTLTDDGGPLESTIERRRGGSFTPISIELSAFAPIYRTGTGTPPDPKDKSAYAAWAKFGDGPLPLISLLGLRGDRSVEVMKIDAPVGGITSIFFGEAFRDILALSLSITLPDELEDDDSGGKRHYQFNELTGLKSPGKAWCYEYCIELRADNLVVDAPAEVPLPASGLMLAGALAGFGFWRMRRSG